MSLFAEALNHPIEAYKHKRYTVSWALVIITILINSVFEPILHHFFGVSSPEIDFLNMLKITEIGILSYIIICFAFWVVCKCFGSKTTFTEHLSTWGISYFPTALCSIVVAITEVFFFLFWNNTILGMLLNIVFVAILIWKFVLYFIYLKEFAGLVKWRFFAAFIIMGIIILIMAALNGYVGLKTPIL